MAGKRRFLTFFVGLILGASFCLIAIWGFHPNFTKPHGNAFEFHEDSSWTYINPLLACESASDEQADTLQDAKKAVLSFSTQAISSKKASHISLYLRDLKSGSWVGIKEDAPYRPVSLAKVAVMLTYLRMFEKDSDIAKEKIIYNNQLQDNILFIQPKEKLELGKEYTIPELVRRMIVYSDNFSMRLLLDRLGPDKQALQETINDLGIPLLDDRKDSLSVKSYATLFRILYNASYLSRELSETALNMLANTDFDDGIVAGVPQNIKVAHKFGEYSDLKTNEKQLHDCGIVYMLENPYLICIMTKGDDFEELKDVIAETSRIVYEKMSQSKK